MSIAKYDYSDKLTLLVQMIDADSKGLLKNYDMKDYPSKNVKIRFNKELDSVKDKDQIQKDSDTLAANINEINTNVKRVRIESCALCLSNFIDDDIIDSITSTAFSNIFLMSKSSIYVIDQKEFDTFIKTQFQDSYLVDLRNLHSDMHCVAYEKTDDILSKLVLSEMYRALDLRVDLNESLVALGELWSYQTRQKADLKISDDTAEFYKTFDTKYKNFIELIHYVSQSTSTYNLRVNTFITYRNLLMYFKEVTSGKLESDTTDVQNWLSLDTKQENNLLDYTVASLPQHIQNKLANIQPMSHEKNQKHLYQFNKDPHYVRSRSQYKMCAKYTLGQGFSSSECPAGSKILHLVHGTKQLSVYSILVNGLLTSAELADLQSKDYEYTASGLGDGLYFAREDQVTKSLNYTSYGSNNESEFLFTADVLVPANSIKHVTKYGDYTHNKYPIICADRVGTRANYDEILVKDSSLVRLTGVYIFSDNSEN